jgi:hypothetical protein
MRNAHAKRIGDGPPVAKVSFENGRSLMEDDERAQASITQWMDVLVAWALVFVVWLAGLIWWII